MEKNEFQHRNITKSGFNFSILFPVEFQVNGFIESRDLIDGMPIAGFPVSYCVFPGNNNSGYCLLKL